MSNTVADLDFDFPDLLADASNNAGTDWEMGFVSDIEEKYEDFGDSMFISTRQIEILEKIAGW